MAENKTKRPDTPLAPTPTPPTILDDIQKASDARLQAKREKQKTKSKEAIQSGAATLQGLASLKNTLGKKITRKTK